MQWIVFYANGCSFSNKDGSPWDAPRWGVVCVAEKSAEHGRVIWVGHDYYWLDEDGQWACGDFLGLLDYLAQPYPTKVVLYGRSLPATKFHKVYQMAVSDTRLPPKTSTDWCEEKSI